MAQIVMRFFVGEFVFVPKAKIYKEFNPTEINYG